MDTSLVFVSGILLHGGDYDPLRDRLHRYPRWIRTLRGILVYLRRQSGCRGNTKIITSTLQSNIFSCKLHCASNFEQVYCNMVISNICTLCLWYRFSFLSVVRHLQHDRLRLGRVYSPQRLQGDPAGAAVDQSERSHWLCEEYVRRMNNFWFALIINVSIINFMLCSDVP